MIKTNHRKSVLLRSWKLLSTDRCSIFIGIALSFGASAFSILSGYTLRILVDDILPAKKLEQLWPIQLVFIGAVLFANCFDLLHTYLFEKAGQKAQKALRDSMFDRLLKTDYFSRIEKTIANVIATISYKVDALSDVLENGIPKILISTVDIVASITFMSVLDWRLTLLSIPIFPVLIFASSFMRKKITNVQRKSQIAKEEMASSVSELLECYSTIDNFKLSSYMKNRFSEQTASVGNKALRLQMCYKIMSLFSWALIIVPYQAILYGIGGTWLITKGAPTIGLMLVFANLTNHMIQPVMSLITVSNSVASARAAYDFLDEYMESLPEKKNPIYAQPPEQTIAYAEKLYYTYPGKDHPTISGIAFNIRKSSIVALWGNSGCGKSTLLRILSKQIPLQDSKSLSLDCHSSVGYFSQTPHMFRMSLLDNFRLAKAEITQSEIWKSLKLFAIDTLVAQLPNGLETEMLNAQGHLSLGEFRRLCLTVFCSGKNDVLLLDEPTASLDADNAGAIMNALVELNKRQGKTLIIATHDKALLSIADMTVYLDA